MKAQRQAAILQIVQTKSIETQDELARALSEQGMIVTQATVSRDIKELKLLKIQGPDGRYQYASPDFAEQGLSERFIRIFEESVLSVTTSGQIVIIKTLSGSAAAAAEAVDAFKWPEIAGCIAGDNTIFIAVQDGIAVGDLYRRFRHMMKP